MLDSFLKVAKYRYSRKNRCRKKYAHTVYRQLAFTRLKKYVTSYAMRKILPQVKLFEEKELKGEALGPCTGSFTRSLGLPCVHTIEIKNLANEPIKLDDINQHWYFYKPRPT